MNNELLYRIALTHIPNIGDVHGKALINTCGSAAAIFNAKKKDLENIEGIGSVRANNIKSFQDFSKAEKEIEFIDKFKIQPLFITDDAYPKKLLHCYDCPLLLYYRGNADLNNSKILSIIGTRSNSEYGKQITEKIVEDLKDLDVIIVSGLAFGIDTIAHKSALKNNLQTIGVLAHGLDRIYPAQNKTLAKQMIENGGLLTDYSSDTNPDKQNFPKRNRIVAGICDATLVIESGVSGGSLITAELANGYNKDVFAIPGRSIDSKSEGCNFLIKNNKASLVCNASDIIENMRWGTNKSIAIKKQRELFIDLPEHEQTIYDILKQQEATHIDEIYGKSGLSSSTIANALLMLEMKQIIASLPGKMYQVV
jgi:DNA processing protein